MLSKKENRDLTERLLTEFEEEEEKIESMIWNLGRNSLENFKPRDRYLFEWTKNPTEEENNQKKRVSKNKRLLLKNGPIKANGKIELTFEKKEPVFYNPYSSFKKNPFVPKDKKKVNSSSNNKINSKSSSKNSFILLNSELNLTENSESKRNVIFRTKPLNKLTITLDKNKRDFVNKKLEKITKFDNKDIDLKFGKLKKMRLDSKYIANKVIIDRKQDSRASFENLKKNILGAIKGKNKRKSWNNLLKKNHLKKMKKVDFENKEGKRELSLNERLKKKEIRENFYNTHFSDSRFCDSIYSNASKSKYTFCELDKSAKILVKESNFCHTDRSDNKNNENGNFFDKKNLKKNVKKFKFIPKSRVKIQFDIGRIKELIINKKEEEKRNKEDFIIKKRYLNFASYSKLRNTRVMPNTTSIKSLL